MFFFIVTFFIFVLLLIFLLLKVADLTFIFISKLTSNTWNWTATGISFLCSFILSILIVSSFIHFLVVSPQLWQFTSNTFTAFPINTKDCSVIIEAIYQTENAIYNYENHRYIEQSNKSVTIKTLKDAYARGAEKLRNQVKMYNDLKIDNKSKKTINDIATSIKDKANLFEKRIQLNVNEKAFDKMSDLVVKMDSATQTRFKIINEIKQQCTGNLKV